MFYTICYDVGDNNRRLRLFKILKDFGERVQYSVFEANLEEDQLDLLLKRAAEVLDEAEDSLRLYPLCGMCQAKIDIRGQGKVSQDPEFIIV